MSNSKRGNPNNQPNNDQEGKPRQGRRHLNRELADSRVKTMDVIQEAFQVMYLLANLKFPSHWQIAKRFFLARPDLNGKGLRTEGGARTAANRYCIMRLREAGLVDIKSLSIRKPGVYYTYDLDTLVLTPKGHKQLQMMMEEEGLVDDEGRPLPTRWTKDWKRQMPMQGYHHWRVNDMLLGTMAACELSGYEIVQWFTADMIDDYREAGLWPSRLKPDAGLIFHDGHNEHSVIFEADGDTESLVSSAPQSWSSKFDRYARFYKKEIKDSPYWKGHPVPLLLIGAPDEDRAEAIIDTGNDLNMRTQYWGTSYQAFEDPASLLDHLWRVCGDPDGRTLADKIALAPARVAA